MQSNSFRSSLPARDWRFKPEVFLWSNVPSKKVDGDGTAKVDLAGILNLGYQDSNGRFPYSSSDPTESVY